MDKKICKVLVTSIPGIGTKYAKRLSSIGVRTQSDLISQFKRLDQNSKQFQDWIKQSCRAYSNHAQLVYSAVEKLNTGENITKPYVQERAVSTNVQLPDVGLNCPSKSGADLAKEGDTSLQVADLLPITMQAYNKGEELPDCKENDTGGASKIRRDFSQQLYKANKNLVRLQHEFGKLQNLSLEFDEMVDDNRKRKTDHSAVELKGVQDSLEAVNRRIDDIAINQQEFATVLLKMEVYAKKQNKADRLILDSLSTTLAKLDAQMEQATTNKQPPEWATDIKTSIHDVNKENREIASKICITLIVNCIVCLIVTSITLT